MGHSPCYYEVPVKTPAATILEPTVIQSDHKEKM